MRKTFVFKQDLAAAYFPYICARAARQKLSEIIHSDDELYDRLVKTGYRKTMKQLSPRQVKIIMERLGEPY